MVYSRVTAEGLYALAELPAGPQLRWLSLAGSCQFLPLRGRDRWRYYRDEPLVPDWEVDPDRLAAVLRKHPALVLDLEDCPIPPATQTRLKGRFGDRVRVGPMTGWGAGGTGER